MSRLGFLMAESWLDEDGRHVWLRHECVNGAIETAMLPTTWRVVNDSGRVEPSIDCKACGLHVFLRIGAAPPEVGVQP